MKDVPPDDLEAQKDFNWYPGHMARAIREIKEKLKQVDIVLEIRDARAPLATSNRAMEEVFRQKSRLILLNKVNLADPKVISKWESWFKLQDQPFLFINCFDKSSLKKLLQYSRKIVTDKKGLSKDKLRMMVIGLPNTGKSTLINQLANRNVAKTANKPGQTTGQQWIHIDDTLDLLDTPGVMPPELDKEEYSLWLSALNAIPDSVMGEELPAIFLINYLNENQSLEFKSRYKLESFTLEVNEILNQIATARGCLKQKGLPDYDRVYKLILQDFRNGDLGKCCFGNPPLK